MTKITPTYNLEVLFPKIALQWHPSKNNGRLPNSVAPYSNKKFWWTCENGHSWEASVSSRHRAGCNACRLSVLHLKPNQLLRDNKFLLSELLNTQDNYEKLKDSYIFSTKKVSWKCSTCGDVWQNQIRKRSAENQGCPYCSDKKVAPSKWNSLGKKFPELSKQWDFDKNKLTPYDEVPGSHHHAYWKCARGHSWRTEIRQRTSFRSACPECSYQISKPQKRIYSELLYIFRSVELSYKINQIEIDVYIPDLKIGIEYDGSHYHKSAKSHDRDYKKFIELKKVGIFLIRVRGYGLGELPNVPCVLEQRDESVETLKDILKVIKSQMNLDEKIIGDIDNYLKVDCFQNDALYDQLLLNKRVPIFQISLAYTHSHLAKEWSPRNLDSPEDITSGIHEKRWWICRNCNREYQATVNSRAKQGSGCGYCSGRYATTDNNLERIFPKIAKELHPTKNNKSAFEISPKSNDKLWWICANGHEYEMTVVNRTDKGQGCKFCRNRVPTANHNLAVKSPNLSKWLDEVLTGKAAAEIMPNAALLAYWKCPEGHSWARRVDHQVRSGLYCRECSKLGVLRN
jgi:hypothetical protein